MFSTSHQHVRTNPEFMSSPKNCCKSSAISRLPVSFQRRSEVTTPQDSLRLCGVAVKTKAFKDPHRLTVEIKQL